MGHAQDRLNQLLSLPTRIGRGGRMDATRFGQWLKPTPKHAAPPSAVERPPSPLLRTATPLLALMLRVPGLTPPTNIDGLRQRIIAALRRFQSAARAAHVPPDQMRAAHFILCAALDDIIAHTAWGRAADWTERGLIRTFHKTIEPGPSFATLLTYIQATPAEHLEELELVAICMALGFEGRTRTMPQGKDAFQRLRDDIHRIIAQERRVPVHELSPSWRGVTAPPLPLAAVLPTWVVACLTGVALTGLYIVLAFSLGRDADRTFKQLAALLPDRPAMIVHQEPLPQPAAQPTGPPPPTAVEPSAPPAQPEPPAMPAAPQPLSARALKLQAALAREAGNGLVEILSTSDAAAPDILRIPAGTAFARNGDTLSRPGHDLAEHLAALLDHEPGRILVVGHTDDSFEPSLRFHSSVALTEARARAIARILVAHLNVPERVDIEGRADTEPLLPNTSAANRDRNRRVEIILAPEEKRR